MHLWRRDLLRSLSKRAQLLRSPLPLALLAPRGALLVELLHHQDLATVTKRKGRDCSENVIWCFSIPAYILEGHNQHHPLPCFAQVFLLLHQVFPTHLAQVWTVWVLPGCWRVMWKEAPLQRGDRQESPCPCSSPGQCPAAGRVTTILAPAGAWPGDCMSANKVLGDPSGWKALYKCKSTCDTPGSTSLGINKLTAVPHLECSLPWCHLKAIWFGNSNGSNIALHFISTLCLMQRLPLHRISWLFSTHTLAPVATCSDSRPRMAMHKPYLDGSGSDVYSACNAKEEGHQTHQPAKASSRYWMQTAEMSASGGMPLHQLQQGLERQQVTYGTQSLRKKVFSLQTTKWPKIPSLDAVPKE